MAGAFKSLRNFIDFLETKDDLVRVKQTVDPDLEINAIGTLNVIRAALRNM